MTATKDYNAPRTVEDLQKWLERFPKDAVVYATLDRVGQFRVNVREGSLSYPFLLPTEKEKFSVF